MARLELRSTLSLDGRQFFSTIKAAEQAGASLGASLKSQLASGFSVGAITAFTRAIINAADEIKDISEQLGISTDDVQKLQFAFNRTGLEASDFVSALTRMNRAVDDAVESGKGLDLFERMGLSRKQLQEVRGNSAAVVKLIADAFAEMDRASQRSAARDLFGKSGERFLEALSELRKNADRIPLVSKADLDNVEKLKNQLAEIKRLTEAAGIKTVSQSNPLGGVASFLRFVNPNALIGGALFNLKNTFRPVTQGNAAPFGSPQGTERRVTPFVPDDVFNRNQELLRAEAELQERIFNWQLKRKATGEQIAAIEARIAHHLDEAAASALNRVGREDAERSLAEAAKLTDLLVGMRSDSTYKPNLNALQRIGGAGGEQRSLADPLRVSNDKLEKIYRELQSIQRTIRENGDLLQ